MLTSYVLTEARTTVPLFGGIYEVLAQHANRSWIYPEIFSSYYFQSLDVISKYAQSSIHVQRTLLLVAHLAPRSLRSKRNDP